MVTEIGKLTKERLYGMNFDELIEVYNALNKALRLSVFERGLIRDYKKNPALLEGMPKNVVDRVKYRIQQRGGPDQAYDYVDEYIRAVEGYRSKVFSIMTVLDPERARSVVKKTADETSEQLNVETLKKKRRIKWPFSILILVLTLPFVLYAFFSISQPTTGYFTKAYNVNLLTIIISSLILVLSLLTLRRL